MDYKMAKKINAKRVANKKGLIELLVVSMVIFSAMAINFGFVSAQDILEQNICCEKTTNDLYCQNVPASQCDPDSSQVPTSCESTSFCKPAYCYNSFDGTCSSNTPKTTCEGNGGTWSEEFPAQCELGCCALGDQAAFTTLTKCKKLAASFGIEANYKTNIESELECGLYVVRQQRGACVFEEDFERTCKFTTREDCSSVPGREFFADKLCSDNELATNCGPTTRAECLPGKEEIYFIDSCGNPANIYDKNRINDADYWNNLYDKSESCNPSSPNVGSGNCGNCNYLQGSICREGTTKSECVSLKCTGNADELGGVTERKHGESWCSTENIEGVGGRYFRQICNNGEVIQEACADFKQEECIQDNVELAGGIEFTQAACRVNRWRDCLEQTEIEDCENTNLRDCRWMDDQWTNPGSTTIDGKIIKYDGGFCLPSNPPGLEFWNGEGEAAAICGAGTIDCIVTFEEDLFGGRQKCVGNCQCLTPEWEKQRGEVCLSLGDCGPTTNYLGKEGYERGYTRFVDGVEQYTVDEGFFKSILRRLRV